jgi:hypothetical protein
LSAVIFARIIGLRDHSGFLGPLPLPQHPKSRPFTPKSEYRKLN